MDNSDVKIQKYIIVLVITLGIIGGAAVLSNYFYGKRINEIQSVENKIALNLLSSEVQFELLSQLPCERENLSPLSDELDLLGQQVSFMENERGSNDEEVIELKRRYSLFEIKDFLSLKAISDRCGDSPDTILYFYSNEGDCSTCIRQGYVLSKLQELVPNLRVYAFDYHLNDPAMRALIKLNKVEPLLPALVINNKTNYGFTSLADFERFFTFSSSTLKIDSGE